MNEHLLEHYAIELAQLKKQNNLRQLHPMIHDGAFILNQQRLMLNLASNDYLALAQDLALREKFFEQYQLNMLMSSSSSRLLTGNFSIYQQLENRLSQYFSRSALLFNSGYHMNVGILPALADEKTLILADKLIHASIIDGILLSKAKLIRYPHQDLERLEQLLIRYHDDKQYTRVIIVTESIFSMDGDETDLNVLVQLKQKFDKVLLYVDEAHAIGVRGNRGLGCAEQYQVMDQIDFLVGTFGKACASVGGYIICHELIRDYLINFMRPLIFSTALPPINIAWTDFILTQIVQSSMQQKRQYLQQISYDLISFIQDLGYSCPSSSHIIPIILGDNQKALDKAKQLRQAGFYVMAVRHPTVAHHQARLRICLNSQLSSAQLEQFKQQISQL